MKKKKRKLKVKPRSVLMLKKILPTEKATPVMSTKRKDNPLPKIEGLNKEERRELEEYRRKDKLSKKSTFYTLNQPNLRGQ